MMTPEKAEKELAASRARYEARRKNPPGNSGAGCGWIIVGIAGLLLLSMVACPFIPGTTDGVFESAMDKVNKGKSHEITEKERQRIDDIIYWCNICKKPLRKCPH